MEDKYKQLSDKGLFSHTCSKMWIMRYFWTLSFKKKFLISYDPDKYVCYISWVRKTHFWNLLYVFINISWMYSAGLETNIIKMVYITFSKEFFCKHSKIFFTNKVPLLCVNLQNYFHLQCIRVILISLTFFLHRTDMFVRLSLSTFYPPPLLPPKSGCDGWRTAAAVKCVSCTVHRLWINSTAVQPWKSLAYFLHCNSSYVH